jgi:hypothetical protein
VKVLITSKELGEKYGEEPVAVWFRWGEGEVFHMISHYYLQRTELRTQRHKASAASYFTEKGVPMTAEMRAEYAGLALSDVECAKPSAAFMSNVVIDKKERMLRRLALREEAERRAEAERRTEERQNGVGSSDEGNGVSS